MIVSPEALKERRNERFRTINDLMKYKGIEVDSKAWFAIRSTFTTIEINHELSVEESIVVDSIMKAVLTEVHGINTGLRWSDARLYQKR